MSGCNRLQLDTVAKFTNYLPALDTGFMDRDEFREFYKVRTHVTYIMIFLKGDLRNNDEHTSSLLLPWSHCSHISHLSII